MDTKYFQTLEALNSKLEKQVAAQALELQHNNRQFEVEAALEKVRIRATSMRGSSELAETSAVLFQQLNQLNIKALRTAVGIFDDPNGAMELWLTSYSESDEVIRILDYINLQIHPVFENIIPARKNNKPYALTLLQGNQVSEYYQTMSTYIALPKQKLFNNREYFYSFFFSEGTINVVTVQPLTDEECDILIRFATVFGLIYTRFLDLQKLEAQTREVIKQASLDRIRGKIAGMRSTGDLEGITPLIWNELKIFGVPFIRCGVFIINECDQNIQVYLSAPDGHSLAALNLSFNSSPITTDIVDSWEKKIVYKTHWTSQDFVDWTNSLLESGQIRDEKLYRDKLETPESLNLHFIPFAQGMLYIGNTTPIEFDELNLAASLAEEFSVAYARYEDFIKLEKAKQNIESTLIELKAAQSQLVQSEKMASLGELTAGIAHEIQNPLNFVNNFSEINTELIAELKTEINKGNIDEANALADNIEANEHKINHHGKRADAIVKSMLQHSRVSTGEKELTDPNSFVEEYLRLCYHGLRAKDKTFNVTIKTDLDTNIQKIHVIQQDLGRVILNLLTNAFYAVNDKKNASLHSSTQTKFGDKQYEPTVFISTTQVNDRVKISIRDNGCGIPHNIIDKIFQPFFTTKPTGEGTGLGLSLSYDIIKALGGDIKVNATEGEGAEFIIFLPAASA